MDAAEGCRITKVIDFHLFSTTLPPLLELDSDSDDNDDFLSDLDDNSYLSDWSALSSIALDQRSNDSALNINNTATSSNINNNPNDSFDNFNINNNPNNSIDSNSIDSINNLNIEYPNTETDTLFNSNTINNTKISRSNNDIDEEASISDNHSILHATDSDKYSIDDELVEDISVHDDNNINLSLAD